MYCDKCEDWLVNCGCEQRKIISDLEKDLAWATIHLIQELPLDSDRRKEAQEIRKKYKLDGKIFSNTAQPAKEERCPECDGSGFGRTEAGSLSNGQCSLCYDEYGEKHYGRKL